MFGRNLQRVVVGSAIAIAATALIPVIKETLRPIARDLTRQMKYFVVITKEGIEDLAAEVKFERLRKSLDNDIFIESEVVETEHQNRIFQ
ncbi:DUF5132 domain-containing protein [Neobacillus ginsengisoli]|uniref:DUF5132 domain-containing protein n=1 Tax=Neobacillus ginsengisoli TaxID=904295 RepID=A0ABT9XUX2_9BACI|nr:DUF5132 domain-containing protein [Neobacillus ginsengisoli]MDQ0199111.1 hypothetical protein [Neobacillus ginsengisoli]